MQRIFYPTALLLLLLLSACVPAKIVRVEPANDADVSRYFYGAPMLERQSEEVAIEIGFYDADKQFLVFSLELENTSSEDIEVDPRDIFLAPDVGGELRAIDPEIERLGMDMNDSRQTANRKTAALILGAAAVAGAVATIVNDDIDNAADVGNNLELAYDLNTTLNFSGLAVDALYLGTQPSNYYYVPDSDALPPTFDRLFWLDHSLRRTTIRPGERVYGKVVFPRVDEAVDVEIVVPVAGRNYRFPFVQRLYRP
jgi:hypothetical protein